MTIPKVNLSLIFFLFVLFAGMIFAAPTNVTKCQVISAPGLYVLNQSIDSGSVDVVIEDAINGDCWWEYNNWNLCDFGTDPDGCLDEKAAYEACIAAYPDKSTACIQIRALPLTSDSIVLDCQGYTISTPVDYGILVYEHSATLRVDGLGHPYWSNVIYNVEIRNCVIEDSQIGGITLIDTHSSNVTGNLLSHNTPEVSSAASNVMDCSGGINLLGAFNADISDNNLVNNTFGICVGKSYVRNYNPIIISRNNKFYDNQASFNRFTGFGIAGGSFNNTIYDNQFYNNVYGLIIGAAYNNSFWNLNVSNNKYIDFAGDPILYSDDFCNNTFDAANKNYVGGTIEVTGGDKLQLIDTDSFTLTGVAQTNEIIVCADDVTIRDFTMNGDSTYGNNGIFVMGDNLVVDLLISSDVTVGLYTQLSDNIIIQNSTFSDSRNGIMLNSITNADISNNLFVDNIGTGIVGSTSPAWFLQFMGGMPPTYPVLSYIDIYDNEFYGTGDGTSFRDAYPGAYSLGPGIALHPGDLLDLATGSATSLFFAHNVSFYDNYVDDSATYGFAGLLITDSEVKNNEINNTRGISGFSLAPGGLFNNNFVNFTDLLTLLPGTGIVFDGTKSNVTGNNVSGSVSGFVSTVFSLVINGFVPILPDGPVTVSNNELFNNSFVGLGLIGPVIAHSNLIYDNDFGLILGSGNNTIVNNFFNNTDYFYMVLDDNNNTMNIPKNDSLGLNIIYNDFWGGNYWGLTDGTGHSDECDDDGEGFCTTVFNLNVTNANNTDYLPLTGPKAPPKTCIDLDDVKDLGVINNVYGHVVYSDETFYVNADTILCQKTYTTDVNGVFIKINGSYDLNCNQGLSTIYHMYSTTGNAVGILNHNSDVTIKNCNFRNFKEGVVSTPDPSFGLSGTFAEQLFERIFLSEQESGEDVFRKMNLIDNYVNGVFKVNNKWYMFAKGASRVYSNEDYSYITGWEVDTSKYFGVHLSDDKFVSYNNEGMNLLDTNVNPVWVKNFIEEEVEVCEFEWNVAQGPSSPVYKVHITKDGSSLFKCVDSEGLYKSDISDYTNWVPINYGFYKNFQGFSTSYNGEKILFSYNNIYTNVYSLDYYDGVSWIPIVDTIQNTSIYTIRNTKISGDGNILYVYVHGNFGFGAGDYLFTCNRSNLDCNDWLNWSRLDVGGCISNNPEFVISNDGSVIVYNNFCANILYFSKDGGLSWDSTTSYPNGFTPVSNFVLSPDGTTLYVVLQDGYLYLYNLNTKTWESKSFYLSGFELKKLAITDDVSTILMSNRSNVYISYDYGNNFEELDVTIANNPRYYDISISNDEKVLLLDDNNNSIYLGYEECYYETLPVDVVANVYEHLDTGNLYAYVLKGEADLGTLEVKIIAYNVSNGDVMWETVLPNPVMGGGIPYMKKGTFVFNNEGNLVVLYNGKNDIGLQEKKLVVLNYTNGNFISQAMYPGTYNYNNKYPYMFIDGNGNIYDFSISYATTPANPLRKIILQKYKQDGTGYSNATYEIPPVDVIFDSEFTTREVNVLFDGEYIYYTSSDSPTGTKRLYYKVFNSNLVQVAEGEFKPNYEDVTFGSYINEDGNLEFLGYFMGNYSSSESGHNFLAYLNKTDNFEFVFVKPNQISNDYKKLVPVHEFVEIDGDENSIVVGYDRYPDTSKIKISKIDSEGNLLWNISYSPNLDGNVLPLDFLINEDGDYLVGGYFVDENYRKRFFVSMFSAEDGELLEFNQIAVVGDSIDLDFFELDDSYTIIVGSSRIYNLTKSGFTSSLVGPFDGYVSGLEISFDGEKVAVLGASATGYLKLGVYQKNLSEMFTFEIDEPDTSITLNNNYPYGINLINNGTNEILYAYFTYEDGGIVKTFLVKAIDFNLGSPAGMQQIENEQLISLTVNPNEKAYALTYHMDGEMCIYELESNLNFNEIMCGTDYYGKEITSSINSFSAIGSEQINGIEDSFVLSSNGWQYKYLNLESDIFVDLFALELIDSIEGKYLAPTLRIVADESQPEGMAFNTAYYEVDSKGNNELLFVFTEPMYYPVKTFYVGDTIYTLMLNSTYVTDIEKPGYRAIKLYLGNMFVYSFDRNGDVNWVKDTGLYSVGLMDFRGLWEFLGGFEYDSSDDSLLVSGTSLEFGAMPLLQNISLVKYDLDGNEEFNEVLTAQGLSEYNISYPLNLISEVHALNDGYYVIGGSFEPEISYIIRTDKEGEIEWATNIMNPYYETECVGGWEEFSGFESDSAVRISKDGSKLYYSLFGDWTVVNITDKMKKNITPPPNSDISDSFDMSANGEVMLAFSNWMGNGTWYLYNNSIGEWEYIPGFNNITQLFNSYSRVSSDGQTMLIGFRNGTIYRSESGGALGSWNKIDDFTTELDINNFEMSGNGETILISYFVSEKNVLNISLNGGDSWNELTLPDDNLGINDVEITEDGSKVFFVLIKGEKFDQVFSLYTYNVNTEIWEQIGMDLSLDGPMLAISGDGSKIIVSNRAFNYNRLYLSEDSGITFRETQPAGNSEYGWYNPDMSLNGKIIVYHQTYDSFIGDWIKGLYMSNETEEEVCETSLVTDSHPYIPLRSFVVKDVFDSSFFVTVSDLLVNETTGNLDEEWTLVVNNSNGEIVGEFESSFFKAKAKEKYLHALMYPYNTLGSFTLNYYVKSNRETFTSFATLPESILLQGAIAYPRGSAKLFDMQPTTYGLLVSGAFTADTPMGLGSGVAGYAFKKVYAAPALNNVNIENIGIFKTTDSLLVDLTTSDTEVNNLAVGCSDMRCIIRFLGINGADGYLSSGLEGNTYLDPYFVSIKSLDLNARAFNTNAIIRLTLPKNAKNIKIVGADGFYDNRQEILDNGEELEPDGDYYILTCTPAADFCEFKVKGFSSYTLGYVFDGGDDDGSKIKDMIVTLDGECIGERYQLGVRELYMKFVDGGYQRVPIKYVQVKIQEPLGSGYRTISTLETNTNGYAYFTLDNEIEYKVIVSEYGYRTVEYFVTPRDCSVEPVFVCDQPNENYALTETITGDCLYECMITECDENEELINLPSELRCYCKLLDEEDIDEIEEDIPMDIDVYVFDKDNPNRDPCQYEVITIEVNSQNSYCEEDLILTIPGYGVVDKFDGKAEITIDDVGNFDLMVSKKGCATAVKTVKVVDCSEDIYEPVIEVPLHEQLFNALNNIFRASIKNGCEGFYFEGLPTILCDLVWVVVVVGSIVGAYLEPERNRKVIILLAPSIVAIVLIPVAGAIAAAGGVYLAYNSKKHVEGKLGVEKEQIEEEIKKE